MHMTHMRPIQPGVINPFQERKTKPKPDESYVVTAVGEQAGEGRKQRNEPNRKRQADAPPNQEATLLHVPPRPAPDLAGNREAPANAARRFAARQAADDLAALLEAAARSSNS